MEYQFIAADYLDEIVSSAAPRGNTTLASDFEITTSDVVEYELRSNAFKKHPAFEVGASGLMRPGSDSSEAFVSLMDVYVKIDDLSENVFDALEGQTEVIWDKDALALYDEYPGKINDYFVARVDTDRYNSFTNALSVATGGDPDKIETALFEPIEGLGSYDRLIDALRFCANLFVEQASADAFENAIRHVADKLVEASEAGGELNKPTRSSTLSTEADYASVPHGTVVAGPETLELYVKNVDIWHRLGLPSGQAFTLSSESMAGTPRAVLRRGLGE